MALPSYVDVAELVSTLRTLIMRDSERGRLPLPIVCLLNERREPHEAPAPHEPGEHDDARRLTSVFQKELHRAKPVAVPCARVVIAAPSPGATGPDSLGTTGSGSPETTGSGPVLPLLHELCEQLADEFGGDRLRFPHYRLADWLTRQALSDDSADRRAELLGLMVNRAGSGTTVSLAKSAAESAPSIPARVALSFLARFWPVARTWLWLSGAVPGWGRQTRWFVRQRYMSPRPAGDFLGFALKLTVRSPSGERPRQIRLLLVHAFLEDLRTAYRRSPWRPSTWRRTANPVALIDGTARGDQGEELLSLINDVRNETGEDDPLLVVAESDDPAGTWAGGPYQPVAGAAKASGAEKRKTAERSTVKAADAAREWLDGLDSRRHLMRPDAWRLAFTVASDVVRDGAAGRQASFTPPRPSFLARPHVLLSLTTATVLLAGGGLLWAGTPYLRTGCVPLLNHDGVSVTLIDGICVGYSDAADRLFSSAASDHSSAARLLWAEQAIFRQNACVEKALADDPTRKRLTIVYLAGFASDEKNGQAWSYAQAEELEGLLLKQIEQNGEAFADDGCRLTAADRPYLRIVVANGGPGMRYADLVVDDQLSGLIRDDPYVIGVIGLDRSIYQTERAIAALGILGVPVLTTTLSGTDLTHDSPLYFQMVPSNPIQARLVVDYAKSTASSRRPIRRVHIVHPPVSRNASGALDDLYVASLVKSLTDELKAAGITYEDLPWTGKKTDSGKELPRACSDQLQDMIFYAGRHEQFADFLTEIFSQCNTTGQTIPIIADDAITRFLADAGNNPDDIPANVDVGFVSKGSKVVLEGRHCLYPGTTPPTGEESNALATFCVRLSALYAERGRTTPPSSGIRIPRWAGERIGLAYDAAGMLLKAADAPYPTRYEALGVGYEPNRAAVAQQLRDTPYPGVTETFRFDTSRVQDGAELAILHMKNILDPAGPPTCLYKRAYAKGNTATGNLCPRKPAGKAGPAGAQ
ncbi:hypothetical protein AB0395_00150 [Streptosporangium sp. NPDC051023]|uniref:hypothetical protein n=1 Tax=Streptosporangium sp. NPDC051023 TaxID=3155410 RepID=UPI00344B304F